MSVAPTGAFFFHPRCRGWGSVVGMLAVFFSIPDAGGENLHLRVFLFILGAGGTHLFCGFFFIPDAGGGKKLPGFLFISNAGGNCSLGFSPQGEAIKRKFLKMEYRQPRLLVHFDILLGVQQNLVKDALLKW